MEEKYLFVTDKQGLKDAIKCLEDSKVLALDTETTGLDPFIDKVRLSGHLVITVYSCSKRTFLRYKT